MTGDENHNLISAVMLELDLGNLECSESGYGLNTIHSSHSCEDI